MRPPEKPIIVLQILADPKQDPTKPVDNPYTSLLVESLPSDRVQTKYFRWSRCLVENFDVLHVHWPEYLARHSSRSGRAVKVALFTLFLLRIRLQRKAVIRTVHNLRPHEDGSGVERWLTAQLERTVTLWVVLNETTPTPDSSRTVLVPHGHFRDWYCPSPSITPTEGHLVNFGALRPYKGTDELMTAFRGIPAHLKMSLTVCGNPRSEADRARLEELAAGDTHISLDARFVPDQQLADLIASSEMVVLPYRLMHNSSAALLALSLNRPVIIPSSPATELLVDEFGSEWVFTYSGSLETETLLALIELVRSRPRPPAVDMSEREWPGLAERLASAYERADQLARAHR
jgi:beta-1,4-mannosyltransferase